MSRAHEIYPLHRMLEKELTRIGSDANNSEVLVRYYRVRSTQVALATLVNTLTRLRIVSGILNKKFEEATLSDLENLHFEICRRSKKAATRNKYRQLLKKFYQWLDGFPDREFPPRVKWIKTERVPLVAITQEDLIPHVDALRICECALNLRDKALFSGKLDAGCRIGEILTVRVGEVRITEYGAIMEADGKTGRAPVILTWATPNLAQWLNNHPFKDRPDAPLFCDLTKARPVQLSYAAARKAFKECVARAGIKKRVWLHLFKHISSTEDAMNGMPDSFRRYKHHWTQSSKMPGVYEHLSQEIIPKIQEETWKRIGAAHETSKSKSGSSQVSLIRSCQRCKTENSSGSMYCNKCGFALDVAKANKIAVAREMAESLIEKLAKNPETLEKLLALLKG